MSKFFQFKNDNKSISRLNNFENIDNEINGDCKTQSNELHLKPPSLQFNTNKLPLQLQSDEDKVKSEIAGNVNSSGNLIGGIKEVLENTDVYKKVKHAKKTSDIAKKAQKAAGSGKSAIKSERASQAAKSALKSSASAEKALKGSRISKLITPMAKFLDKLPLDGIGAIASFASKLYSSDNTTTAGKLADAGSTSALDTAFSVTHPLAAGIDALIGFIPGGDRVNISNTMSNSVSSITGSFESILTGDISGIDSFHQKSLAGENTWFFEQAAKYGEAYKEREGVSERVERTGDFWGGPETTSGRAGAFAASIPILGEIGEGIGESAGWAVQTGQELWSDTLDFGSDAVDYIGDNYTLNPSEIEWDPREWF